MGGFIVQKFEDDSKWVTEQRRTIFTMEVEGATLF